MKKKEKKEKCFFKFFDVFEMLVYEINIDFEEITEYN